MLAADCEAVCRDELNPSFAAQGFLAFGPATPSDAGGAEGKGGQPLTVATDRSALAFHFCDR